MLHHLHFHPHRLRNDQDIGKDDRCVDTNLIYRLDGDLGGQFGPLTTFEKGVFIL